MATTPADPPRGRGIWCGGASLKRGGVAHDRKRVLVVEFEDTAALQEAANSGFAEFDFADDTVAIVLDSKPGHAPKETP